MRVTGICWGLCPRQTNTQALILRCEPIWRASKEVKQETAKTAHPSRLLLRKRAINSVHPDKSGEPELNKMASLFGADFIIDSASKKSELFANHSAVAVDMESHGAARAAAHAGVPFLAIRAIADPADRALPKAALGAVAPDGSTRVMATLGAALRDPKQFPELMKLGADSAAATKTLRRDLGPLFFRLFLSLDL